jgi:hypothetical protein
MDVEFIPPSGVRDLMARVERARHMVTDRFPNAPGRLDDPAYWESVFEANAAAVLDVLRRVQLPSTHAVRYRFYGRAGGDLLVRPFVARTTTDVSTIRRLIDWHPAPDSVAPALRAQATQDVEFLYGHFTYERSAFGFFEYWVAMQELWASARWVHSRVIADANDFAEITGRAQWRIEQQVERFEPAVILDGDGGAQLAVLLHCHLDRASVALYRIEIRKDQTVQFVEAIPVAHGPRGYVM